MNQAPEFLWKTAENFGFPAALVVLLILFLWVIGLRLVAEMGRLTRAVSLVVLAMQFAPEFHPAAREIYEESLEAARRRKDRGLDAEIAKHHPKP
jgi:hypothetical protein